MLVVLYLAFAALCGVVEAVLYSGKGADAFSRNEHVEMVLQRLAVLLLVPAAVLTYQLSGSWWYILLELVAAVLCFSMVHDEAYNFTRLWIAWRKLGSSDRAAFRSAWREYRYGYQSPTTTARNDFNGTERTLLAVVGVVVWVAGAAVIVVLHG